jgi:hypothetical protein
MDTGGLKSDWQDHIIDKNDNGYIIEIGCDNNRDNTHIILENQTNNKKFYIETKDSTFSYIRLFIKNKALLILNRHGVYIENKKIKLIYFIKSNDCYFQFNYKKIYRIDIYFDNNLFNSKIFIEDLINE